METSNILFDMARIIFEVNLMNKDVKMEESLFILKFLRKRFNQFKLKCRRCGIDEYIEKDEKDFEVLLKNFFMKFIEKGVTIEDENLTGIIK